MSVCAVRIPEPVVLDGKLDDPYYAQNPAIDGFIQQEPVEGQPATEKTEAWIFFDDKNLYIGARMWDSEPDRIVANEMRRDHRNISRGASFAVALDTFYDRRNGFYFETNPLGAIRDGLITNESDMNSDWNTVWNANASYFEGGWVVEITIPFRSLRYRQGASPVWGVQLKRVGVRAGERLLSCLQRRARHAIRRVPIPFESRAGGEVYETHAVLKNSIQHSGDVHEEITGTRGGAFTGTPAGVGSARQRPEFLAEGYVVEMWIEGIGTPRRLPPARPQQHHY